MSSDRHRLRSIVLQTLFAWEFRGGDIEAILHYNLVNASWKNPDSKFASDLLKKILLHRAELKKLIAHYAPQWEYKKIAPVDRAAIQIGLTELLFSSEVPDVVAINEAIELAKEFGEESSSKFVNGVLSSVYDDKNSQTLPRT